ncbi:unnamed protein product, partial [Didymodactylos carnosus]
NNFHTITSLFQYYTGLDLLRLNINDILKICGDCIGLRLYNQLKQTIIQPMKTFYIRQINEDYYHCIYLHTLTRKELLQKIIEQFRINKISSIYYCQLYIEQQQQKLKIKLDDDVIKYSINNQMRFVLRSNQNEQNFIHEIVLIDDFFSLKNVIDDGSDVAIIGGGFLGSELACALAHRANKKKDSAKVAKVIQLIPEAGNIGKVLPEYLSKWTTERVREEGAEVITEIEVTGAQMQKNKINIQYLDSSEPKKTNNVIVCEGFISVDHIVVAVGIDPNTELAASGGLEVHPELGGYVVNAELQARHNIWVAGDCACFYDIILGRRRVEHYDHAVVSGKLAGENMTGANKPYWHQSWFWSELGPRISFEAIGLTDSSLQTAAVYAKGGADEAQKEDEMGNREQASNQTENKADSFQDIVKANEKKTYGDDYGKGVVFYLKEGRVVGIVLWNVHDRIPIARKIIKDQLRVTDYQELAKLLNIHQE